MQFLLGFLLAVISVFLILLILVQRGRGGGLTGALGGMGGQSAFGTKAGDTFTRVTIVTATVWILVAILAVKMLGGSAASGPLGNADAAAPSAPNNDATTTGTDLLDDLPETDSGDGATSGDSSNAGTTEGDAATSPTDAESVPTGDE